jgi:sterol desaturase/sphingolipid hydroxylase (fatty acid hydroxylase superfamily)
MQILLLPGSAAEYLPWLLWMLVVVWVAATLEGVVQGMLFHQRYDWRAYMTSVADMLGRRVVDALGVSLAAPVFVWAYAHRLGTIELSSLGAVGGLFLAQEFCYYWYHRAAHRVGWFWATHCVHHSPQQLTLVSALRLGWTGKLTGTGLFFVPMVWLGFAPLAVAGVLAANLLYQFWLHATWIPKLGTLEWVLNTPSHHRVHHGSNAEYLDCNYGGVLIVFDRLFGTCVDERDDVSIRYGLVEPMVSYNPLRVAFHGWWRLGRGVTRAVGWRARLAVVFGPPGGRRSHSKPVSGIGMK